MCHILMRTDHSYCIMCMYIQIQCGLDSHNTSVNQVSQPGQSPGQLPGQLPGHIFGEAPNVPLTVPPASSQAVPQSTVTTGGTGG